MEAAVAFAIGGIVGFLALRLNELGWWFGAAVLSIMSVYYVVRRRQADTGWLLTKIPQSMPRQVRCSSKIEAPELSWSLIM